jgi:hypothetical protein
MAVTISDEAVIFSDGSTQTTATVAIGAVGTYAFLVRNSNESAIAAGSYYAGSTLRYGGVSSGSGFIFGTLLYGSGAAPAGTWLALGDVAGTGQPTKGTLFWRAS